VTLEPSPDHYLESSHVTASETRGMYIWICFADLECGRCCMNLHSSVVLLNNSVTIFSQRQVPRRIPPDAKVVP
jgi:hypothetical protein